MPPVSALLRSSLLLGLRRAAPSASASTRPFTRVEVYGAIADARPAWAELAASAPASPYQNFEFARTWFATIGAAEGMAPSIVVARDDAGAPVALLPLARTQRGPLRLAVFLGGKDSNFNLGLFRPGPAWAREDVAALFREAGRRATPRLDAFLLGNQPLQWRGFANPLALCPRQPSPSFAYKSALPADFSAWLEAHASKETKKKMRKKLARLEAIAAGQPWPRRRSRTARARSRGLSRATARPHTGARRP